MGEIAEVDLTVIVTSWNTRELTLSCIDRLADALRPGAADGADALRWELLVVDNGSRDGSAEALQERIESDVSIEGRCLALPENVGFAAANNRALAEMRGRFALLLNSDAAPRKGAVERCLSTLEADPKISILGPQLHHGDGRLQNSVHAFPSAWTELVPLALLEWVLPRRYPSKRRPVAEPIDVEAVQGAALFVRRSAIDEIGPLPEEYFFFLEETAWCWRARAAGHRVVFEPRAHVDHASGASSKAPHPGATAIEFHRSLYRFLVDHRGALVGRIAVALRFARAASSVVLLAPRAPWSARVAHRLRARWAVFRWHLAGCPSGHGLRTATSRRAHGQGTLGSPNTRGER